MSDLIVRIVFELFCRNYVLVGSLGLIRLDLNAVLDQTLVNELSSLK